MNEHKDYYAILQVHPKAESIVITAAYRRLAAAYHPDVNKSPDANEKMTAINEAYEVLVDEARRREYDRLLQQENESVSKSQPREPRQQSESPSSEKQKESHTHTENKDAKEPEDVKAPKAPKASDFGISDDYFKTANLGAVLWQSRERRLASEMIWAVMLTATIASIITAYMLLQTGSIELTFMHVAPFSLLPIGAGFVIGVLQRKHDDYLLESKYAPKYDPAPSEWMAFAQAVADYELSISEVYVSRSGYRLHRLQYCSGMSSPIPVKKYFAESRGYTPCSKCGFFFAIAKKLPKPFSSGAPMSREEYELQFGPIPSERVESKKHSENRAEPKKYATPGPESGPVRYKVTQAVVEQAFFDHLLHKYHMSVKPDHNQAHLDIIAAAGVAYSKLKESNYTKVILRDAVHGDQGWLVDLPVLLRLIGDNDLELESEFVQNSSTKTVSNDKQVGPTSETSGNYTVVGLNDLPWGCLLFLAAGLIRAACNSGRTTTQQSDQSYTSQPPFELKDNIPKSSDGTDISNGWLDGDKRGNSR